MMKTCDLKVLHFIFPNFEYEDFFDGFFLKHILFFVKCDSIFANKE